MALMTAQERGLATGFSRLAYANPFLPERIDAEQEILGSDFIAAAAVWSAGAAEVEDSPNLQALDERARALADSLRRRRVVDGGSVRGDEASLYEDVVLYVLYNRYLADLSSLVVEPKRATGRTVAYQRFVHDVEHYLGPLANEHSSEDAARLFAFFFQVRRAFHFTFHHIRGGSLAAARLRAAVWQSIFTRDPRRYRRTLWERMDDVTTLIAGPSGTGKDLVAQAIGRSRYIPFDPVKQAFTSRSGDGFVAVNLSALPTTLIESELFGHRRGAFTGAVVDRAGWLETCPPRGTVFLDEVAEIEVVTVPLPPIATLRDAQVPALQSVPQEC